jgi:hypothetical protein
MCTIFGPFYPACSLLTRKWIAFRHPDNGDGNLSWTDAPVQFVCDDASAVGPPGTFCQPSPLACDVNGTAATPHPRWCAVDVPLNGSAGNHTLADAMTVADATTKLRFAATNLEKNGQPFFLGVGLQKPHLDFRVPRAALDPYPPDEQIPVAKHPVAQAGRPPVSIHCPFEGPSYESMWKAWGYVSPWTEMRPASAQQMRRYYVSVIRSRTLLSCMGKMPLQRRTDSLQGMLSTDTFCVPVGCRHFHGSPRRTAARGDRDGRTHADDDGRLP